MRFDRLVILVLGGSVIAATATAAQRGTRSPRRIALGAAQVGPQGQTGLGSMMRSDSALDRFAERLDMTEEQHEQLRDLATQYRSDIRDALERFERMREELRSLRDSVQRPSRETLAEVARRYDHPDLELTLADRRLARNVRSLLKPDQQRRLSRGIVRSQRTAPRVLPRSRLDARREIRRSPRRLRRPSPSMRYRIDRRMRRIPRASRRRPIP